MASIKTLKVNDKVYEFQFNNNGQYSGVVNSDGALVPEEQDPVVSILREMDRYDDGEKHSKPQPKVKIGDQVIKLGRRYFTDDEKDAASTYVKGHSSKGSGAATKTALFTERVATLKSLKECIAEINDEKASAPIAKRYNDLKAQLLEDLDPTTKALIDAGIIVF